MAGCLFNAEYLRSVGRDGSVKRSSDSASICKIAILAAYFAAISLARADASAMDWLNSNQKVSRARSARVEPTRTPQVNVVSIEEKQITGGNLDSYQFVQSHYSSSRSRLEQACRAISSRYNDAAVRDILQKLFVIDTQLFRESIKNSALAVKEILEINGSIAQGLQDLNRIITAPGQETLDKLDKTIDQVGAANVRQTLHVSKYLVGIERTIQMSQAAYETLELIPSLSVTGLDLLIQYSKQLMRTNQSNAEAFKGLLLNVQSSTEMVASGLDNIKKTVRETLRFSDHFAVKQFPLINLPTPSREKIFVQLNSLANSVKSVENTVSIGDSQVRNTAQQFTHLSGGFVAKAAESLKYQNSAGNEKPLEQISTYARNQVSGLFLRIKEDVTAMRTEMARAARPTATNLPPAVKIESRDEYATRRAQNVSSQKLPLFLLGGTDKTAVSEVENRNVASADRSSDVSTNLSVTMPENSGFIALKTMPQSKEPITSTTASTQILYQESDFSADENALLQPEMNILSKELGGDFFFGDSGEDRSAGSVMASGMGMPDSHEDYEGTLPDEYDSGEMKMSYGNLGETDSSEMEMLRFDAVSSGVDSNDLLPMMRFDSEVLDFAE